MTKASAGFLYLGKAKFKVLVDAKDRKRVENRTWNIRVRPNGSVEITTHVKTGHRYVRTSLARFLMKPAPGQDAYKIPNSPEGDFRRVNLRIGDKRGKRKSSGKISGKFTSSFKGVYRLKDRWRAILYSNGRSICLGLYETEASAAEAYNAAAQVHFGEEAFLNDTVDAE